MRAPRPTRVACQALQEQQEGRSQDSITNKDSTKDSDQWDSLEWHVDNTEHKKSRGGAKWASPKHAMVKHIHQKGQSND